MRMSRLAVLLLLISLPFPAIAGPETVTYYYTDPLGTPLIEADSAGNVLRTFDYRPYGADAMGSGVGDRTVGYTGHIMDDDSGLIYMQARYYDASIGRFLSVDPQALTASVGNLFFANRFAYANNAPTRYTDAHGDKPGDHFRTPEAAALDALQYINGRSIAENLEYQGYVVVQGKGDFVATDPVRLAIDGGSTEGTPTGAVGDYHTHGDWTMGTPDHPIRTNDPSKDTLGSGHFSRADIARYRGLATLLGHQYRGYLATPGGSYLYYDATSQSSGDLQKAVEQQNKIDQMQREFEERQRTEEFTGRNPVIDGP